MLSWQIKLFSLFSPTNKGEKIWIQILLLEITRR